MSDTPCHTSHTLCLSHICRWCPTPQPDLPLDTMPRSPHMPSSNNTSHATRPRCTPCLASGICASAVSRSMANHGPRHTLLSVGRRYPSCCQLASGRGLISTQLEVCRSVAHKIGPWARCGAPRSRAAPRKPADTRAAGGGAPLACEPRSGRREKRLQQGGGTAQHAAATTQSRASASLGNAQAA